MNRLLITPRSARALLLACLVAFGLAAAGCSPKASSNAPEPPKTVRVVNVGRADIIDMLSYPAELKPIADVRLFSPVADRILLFPWNDGDEVKRGERIALIKKDGLDHGLEQLSAQLEGLDAQIRNLESERKQTRDLLEAGAISPNAFDKVETAYLAAVAQRKALRAGRAQLAVTAGNAVITSPIDGVIAGKTLEKGDMASPAQPLCQVLDISKLKVELRIVERDVRKVRVGQAVQLRLDAYPEQTFTGTVTNVLPYLDAQTRTNTVEVTLDNPADSKTGQRQLKPGMFGRAEIVVESRKQVLVAPEQALLMDNRLLAQQKSGELLRKAMVVGDDGVAHERVVRLGPRNGTNYEIVEGLKDGERLVVRGQHGLKDGQKVEVLSNQSP